MKIAMNGDTREIPDDWTVTELLKSLDLRPGPLAVEMNRRIIPRDLHSRTVIHDGDRIEIVSLMGGG